MHRSILPLLPLLTLSGSVVAQSTTHARIGKADSLTDTATGACIKASSVAAAGKLYPLGQNLFVEEASGSVGVGTTFPSGKLGVVSLGHPVFGSILHVSGDADNGNAIFAHNQDSAGTGITSLAEGKVSTGVAATAYTSGATTGRTVGAGISGWTSIVGGGAFGPTSGVAGYALIPANDDAGVTGRTESQGDGAGVVGHHLSTLGAGAGVEGFTTSKDTNACAIRGTVVSSAPAFMSAAVRGVHPSTNADGIGVWGSHAGMGIGVHGTAGSLGFGGFFKATGTGSVGVCGEGDGFGVFSLGDLGASGVKSFVQPHPTDAALEVRFVCLEGNESGTYFRGSSEIVGGRAVIAVPEEFRLVTEREGMTVQVTPRGPGNMWVARATLGEVVVRGERDVPFDYFVNGVRAGFSDHVPIRPNTTFVPRVRGQAFGTGLPETVRETLVETGILNSDYTPNEATAHRLGWTLADPPAERAAKRAPRMTDVLLDANGRPHQSLTGSH